jgi:hypothetical protein
MVKLRGASTGTDRAIPGRDAGHVLFIALVLAILLIHVFLPGFNGLVYKQLGFDLLTPTHLIGMLAIGVFCGLVAGSYPAFYLSSFQPVAVLKGQRIGLNNGYAYLGGRQPRCKGQDRLGWSVTGIPLHHGAAAGGGKKFPSGYPFRQRQRHHQPKFCYAHG